MGVHSSIWLTFLALVLIDSSMANPLLDFGIAGRTLFQQNMKCGTRSAYKRISMTNPSTAQNCEYTIRAYSTKVCQLRIEFTYLELDQPTVATTGSRQYAFCNGDHLTIEGMPFDLCGILRDQHVYVPFDAARITQEMTIKFHVSSNSYSRWIMEVHQIECGHKAALVTPDEREAPDGCLQYFHQSSARVESFNFGGGLYYGDTKYAICFNRNYNENAVLELSEISFSMDEITAVGSGFDDGCLNGNAGDSKDYIAIPFAEVTDGPHSLFCGESLKGDVLTYNGAGPIVIHVNTDSFTDATSRIETGFSFRYRILNRR